LEVDNCGDLPAQAIEIMNKERTQKITINIKLFFIVKPLSNMPINYSP